MISKYFEQKMHQNQIELYYEKNRNISASNTTDHFYICKRKVMKITYIQKMR